ncbi:MAG: hypothetical protein AB8U78_06300 [Rickettsia slovaca]|uniref:Uncharacterized protein n=1 Tax=Rickettsia slovaca str. D-CWPP TaxID=1105109 RepID=H8LNK3_RICSL|nr:hypothetical protein [Rickettsia slovaca]AFD19796.1 hypothetical protein MC3_04375 [Rickettsia slovaca str. D-CWPP]
MAHKDLSHLTEEQIKDLIKRYYNYEKIANLLEVMLMYLPIV